MKAPVEAHKSINQIHSPLWLLLTCVTLPKIHGQIFDVYFCATVQQLRKEGILLSVKKESENFPRAVADRANRTQENTVYASVERECKHVAMQQRT